MKNIIVISDTHARLPKKFEFWEALENVDYIIHLGDGLKEINTLKEAFGDKFIYVYGNCDHMSGNDEQLLDIEGVRIFITHGHNYKVKSNLMDLHMRGIELNAKCCLYGHTHRPTITEYGDIKLINPGSLTYAATYCYMTVKDNKVLSRFVNLIE